MLISSLNPSILPLMYGCCKNDQHYLKVTLFFIYSKKYKYQPGERVFPKENLSATSGTAENTNMPLQGMKFVVAGRLSKSKSQMSKAINDLGGQVVSQVNDGVSAVIGSESKLY